MARYYLLILLSLVFGATASRANTAENTLVPIIDGPWWQIAGNPDVAPYTSEQQQPVDFAVWQAADGTWELWSCIRDTKYPNWTRFFYRWEGSSLTDHNWRPMGIAMTSDTKVGEVEGLLQAPYVMKYHGRYLMFYGSGAHIDLATSTDGKVFQRHLVPGQKVGLFSDGFGTRDPMAIDVGGIFYLYYSANPGSAFAKMDPYTPYSQVDRLMRDAGPHALEPNVDLLRTSKDLVHWSVPKVVAAGGEAGRGGNSAECPFVYFHEASGYYYLFRTQRYGRDAQTKVYRSRDPTNFGVDDDRYLVATLPIAAPEIIESKGQVYIAALLPSLKGIQIAKLKFEPKNLSGRPH